MLCAAVSLDPCMSAIAPRHPQTPAFDLQRACGTGLEGAILIPHDEIDAGIRKLDLSPNTPIYLYCRSGRRAGMARDRLHELNYNTVINVGGIDDARRLTGQD